jgi:hypothetical protein
MEFDADRSAGRAGGDSPLKVSDLLEKVEIVKMTVYSAVMAFFFDLSHFQFFRQGRAGVVWKGCLVRDLEDFDFFDLETRQTRENHPPVQSSVVGVSGAKSSPTVGVCATVIGNRHVIKAWTPFGLTNDCLLFLCGFQRKSPPARCCADSSA